MKKALISLCLVFLFLISSSSARMTTMIIGTAGSGVVSCYDCSSTGWFIWEMNSTTVGEGSPCGCGDIDTSATLYGDADISAGKMILDDIVADDGDDGYKFDGDAAIDELGTAFLRFTVNTWVDETWFFSIFADGTNNLYAELQASNEIKGRHNGDSSGINVVTTDANLTTRGDEYIVRLRWRTSIDNPNLTINVYDTSMVEKGSGASGDSNLTSFATEPTTDDLLVGNEAATGGAKITYEYIRIYKEWLDNDPNG